MIDLLGLLAYALLVAFFRLAEDAALADSLADKADLGEMAVAEFGHFQLLRRRIQELNVDPYDAMHPFVPAIDEFHARTAPSNWLEGLVKAYVGDGIAADFYRRSDHDESSTTGPTKDSSSSHAAVIAGVQFHPEASPGPFDARRIFAQWLDELSPD